MGKKSPLLKIEPSGMPLYRAYRAVFTKHQWDKVPKWAAEMLKVYEHYDNHRHMCLWIDAKDELQAMMRFNQLWDGLPKKGPNDA